MIGYTVYYIKGNDTAHENKPTSPASYDRER